MECSAAMRLPCLCAALVACSSSTHSAGPDGALPPPDATSGAPDADVPPAVPAGLTHWVTGDPADVHPVTRAGVILMGGGTDVDAAFAWQRDRIGGGDVVVLRASGADGYNDYLYTTIGGVDSVETLLVDSRALASEPYVRWAIDHAEAVFLAGGDQSVYVAAWAGTPLATALDAAYARGAVIGGTSAGCAFLAGIVYTAANGSVLSSEALADPYDTHVTLEKDVLALPPLAGVITDTHFVTRDRMGRLLAFTARAIADGLDATPLGLGVDEQTAIVIDEHGIGTVVGSGAAYALAPTQPPARCSPGESLTWQDVTLYALHAGDTIAMPVGTTTVTRRMLSAANGALVPANPY